MRDHGIGELGGKGHGEINTGSNTAAGDDVTVPDDASGVRDRTEEREKFAPGPMAGSAFSCKQTGCAEDQGACTDRCDVPSAPSQRADHGQVSAVLDSLNAAKTAGDAEYIAVVDLFQWHKARESEPVGGNRFAFQ